MTNQITFSIDRFLDVSKIVEMQVKKKTTLVVVFMGALEYKNYITLSDYLHYGLKYL